MFPRIKIKTLLLLFTANVLLISMGWILAFYAYPRLPQEIPLWVNFFNQPALTIKRSLVFFVYPMAQTLFCAVFWIISRAGIYRLESSDEKKVDLLAKKMSLLSNLRKEFIYMILIFFNLIFIHLQRAIIFLAHGRESGIDEVYFCSLFGIILVLIPLYRLREKLLFRN